MDILISFLIYFAFFFVAGAADVCAEVFFGGSPVVAVFHTVEGLVPHALEYWVDQVLTVGTYVNSCHVAAVIADQNNFELAVLYLRDTLAGRPELVHRINELTVSREFFVLNFPVPTLVQEHLWLPHYSAPGNWFVKFFINAWPQFQLSSWVASQVSLDNKGGLWLLIELYNARQ